MEKKDLHDNNLLEDFFKNQNFNVMEFEVFRNSNVVCFKISKFQEFFITCKWDVIYMTHKTKL
jgi:hypothetical protein